MDVILSVLRVPPAAVRNFRWSEGTNVNETGVGRMKKNSFSVICAVGSLFLFLASILLVTGWVDVGELGRSLTGVTCVVACGCLALASFGETRFQGFSANQLSQEAFNMCPRRSPKLLRGPPGIKNTIKYR